MLNKNLFATNLKRLNILKTSIKKFKREINIAVYRNHSFEMIASVLNSFLSLSRMNANFEYSDYDDSLNFDFKNADIQLIWIDIDRYKLENIKNFLSERVNVLRNYTKAPILLIYTGYSKFDLNNLTTDCYTVSISDILNFMGDNIYDIEKEPYSGTRLSDKACLEMARMIGLKYIPAVLQTPLKAIVVDLDNTLYKGILGEDGIVNLVPNNELQKQLKQLKEQGFFLCIASKNEKDDVKELFEKRKDFVLKWNDFTTVQINWDSKAENIVKIAQTLNIGTDSILFIDDNPAEIQNVESTGIETILVDDDICQIIKYYPRLLKLKRSNEDSLRTADVQANIERAKLAQILSPAEYFKKLGIKLEYSINNKSQVPRIAELFGKTNQFILTYARYKESDVLSFMNDENKIIITIHMSDNLSDSGIIAIIACHSIESNLYLDELTVSCRALGRKLENVMLPYLFKIANEELRTNGNINILYKEGPRNMPAIKWLSDLTNTKLEKEGDVQYIIPKDINLTGLMVEVIK